MEQEKTSEEIENELRDLLKSTSRKELIEMIVLKEKILSSAKIEIEIADYEKMNWISLPVILQDLGFKLKELKGTDENPPMDIYYRNGLSCFKNTDNLWVVAKDDYLMAFNVISKFHAFQLFTMLGIDFKNEDSSGYGLDQSLEQVLTKGRKWLETEEGKSALLKRFGSNSEEEE